MCKTALIYLTWENQLSIDDKDLAAQFVGPVQNEIVEKQGKKH
jgi:hypothetical protein